MGLRFGQPPVASLAAAVDGVARLRPGVGGSEFLKAAAEGTTAEAALPHQLYRAQRSDVQAGLRQDCAKPVGWRYLLDADSLTPSAAEVKESEGSPTLARLTESPMVRRTIAKIRELESTPADDDLELNALTIPELSVYGLWLRNADPTLDRYVPLRGPRSLPLDRDYGRDEWWERMEKLANEKLMVDDAPREVDERKVGEEKA